MSHDPERLLDARETSAGLRSALAEARDEVPDLATHARLSASLGLVPPPAAAAGSAAPRAFSLVAKVSSGTLLVAALAAALYGWWRASAPTPVPPPKFVQESPAAATPVEPTPAPAAEKVEALAPEPVPAAAPLPPTSPTSGPERAGAPPSEAQLLGAARNALREGDPRRAGSILDEHARRYPLGTFVQEREVLRIDALVAAGETTRARAAAGRFVARWPDSAHAPRLREIAAPAP